MTNLSFRSTHRPRKQQPATSLGRTPKIFNTSYQPPAPTNNQTKRAMAPIIWLLALVAAMVLVSQLPYFRIQQVDVKGTTDQTTVSQLKDLAGRSIFSSQVTELPNRLLASNLNLSSADCRRGLPNYLGCQVSMRQPALIWRQNNQDYWVDENGLIYSRRAADTPTGPIIEDQSTHPVQIGDSVASRQLVEQYRQLVDLLAHQNLTVEKVVVNDSVYQLSVVISNFQNLSNPPSPASQLTVRMVIHRSLENQVAALIATLQQKGSAITQQVDVRVPDYVYFH
jgi:hypothetical protein